MNGGIIGSRTGGQKQKRNEGKDNKRMKFKTDTN